MEKSSLMPWYTAKDVLSLIDDFKKLLNQTSNDYKSFNDDYNKFKGFQKLVINSGSKLESSLKKLDTEYQQITPTISDTIGFREPLGVCQWKPSVPVKPEIICSAW
jgi:hypothetical protein